MYRFSFATRIALSVILALGLTLVGPSPHTASAAVNQVFLPNITRTLGGVDGWTTPIIVQNTGTAPTDATIALYRFSDGSLSASVKTPLLKPGQSWSFDPRTNPLLTDDTQFSAVVTGTNGQVAATVIEGSGSSWMAYTGTTTGAATVYLPNITRNLGGSSGWNTPFIVQNIGAKATTAAVSFYTFADGTLAKRIDKVDLQPGRSQAFLPWAIDGLQDDTQYAVVVQGTADAQLYAIVNESSGQMAMSYEGLLAGSDVVYLPNVLKYLGGAGHWSTPFIVQNLGAAPVNAAIEFYSFDTGQLVTTLPNVTLQPGRSIPVDVRFTPDTLPPGSYSVVVRGPSGSQLGAVVNEVEEAAGQAMSYVGTGRAQAQVSSFLPYVQKNVGTPAWVSAIIAQNVSAGPATITLTLFDGFGNVAAQKFFPAVKPGAAAVYDPRFDRRLKNGTYSGLVQSTAGVSAVVNVSGSLPGDYAMAYGGSAAPAGPVPAFAASTKQVGPFAFTLHSTDAADIWVESTIDALNTARVVNQTNADVLQVQGDFSRSFATIPTVYVFATTASYTNGLQTLLGYSQARATDVAHNTDALFSPAAQISVVNWEDIAKFQPASAVRHELTHAMTLQVIGANPTLPAWVNEGMAFGEELTMVGSNWLSMESRYGTASMAATGTLFSLADLSSPLTWSGRTGEASLYQYFEAAQAVLMVRADLGQSGLVQVLDLMRQGQSFEAAYAAVSGKPFSEFAAAFPARARALAPTSPGVVAVDDSPIGPGLSFIAYGFAPNTWVNIEVRSSISDDVRIENTTIYGTRYHFLFNDWAPGAYSITVTATSPSAVTVSVMANKR